MAGMEDARVRVNRAKARYEALDRAIKGFPKAYPNAQTARTEEADDGKVSVVARIKEAPPRDWALAVGDILVDLRSALDYAVYALAVVHGKVVPPAFAEKLEFPVCRHPDSWANAIKNHKLHALPAKAIRLIEDEQPYKPKHGGVSKAPLMLLEELVGINKHRFLFVVWSRLDATELKITMLNARPVEFVAYHLPGELKDGTVLADYRVERSAPNGYVKVDPKLTTFVCIEPTEKGWIRLDDVLPRLGGYVESLVGGLEAHL